MPVLFPHAGVDGVKGGEGAPAANEQCAERATAGAAGDGSCLDTRGRRLAEFAACASREDASDDFSTAPRDASLLYPRRVRIIPFLLHYGRGSSLKSLYEQTFSNKQGAGLLGKTRKINSRTRLCASDARAHYSPSA